LRHRGQQPRCAENITIHPSPIIHERGAKHIPV
jgi:hypothetical protein